MNYKPLPSLLKCGDKICQRKYAEDEILEVLKVRDDGQLLLVRENGNAIAAHYTRDELAKYDYELVTVTTN